VFRFFAFHYSRWTTGEEAIAGQEEVLLGAWSKKAKVERKISGEEKVDRLPKESIII